MKQSLLLLLIFISSYVSAENYNSKDNYTGNYESADTWIGGAPAANGVVSSEYVMTIYGTVNRTGNIKCKNGKFIWNTDASLTIESGATLYIDGNLIVESRCDFIIKEGGKVIVTGDVEYKNYMTGGGSFVVEEGAELRVGGALDGFRGDLNGLVIVDGNVSLLFLDASETSTLILNGDKITIAGRTGDVEGHIVVNNPDAIPVLPGLEEMTLEDLLVVDGDLYDYIVEEGLVDSALINKNEWTGQISTDYYQAGNWKDGVPGENAIALIKSNAPLFPVIDSDVELRDLYVEANAQVIIENGAHVTFRNIYNDGSITVNNTNDKLVSLIVKKSSHGDIIFNYRYESMRFFYVGHPITSPSVDSYKALWQEPVKNAFSLQYYYDGYHRITDNVERLTKPLNGVQLMIRDAMTNHDLTFEGEINNTEYYNLLLTPGWHIIANPYSAYYNIHDESVVNVPDLAEDFSGTTGTIYMYANDEVTGVRTVITYNLETRESVPNQFNGLLAPSQAFWISSEEGGIITMNRNRRAHDIEKKGLKSSVKKKKIYIKVKDGNSTDYAMLFITDEECDNITRADSKKFVIDQANKLSVSTVKDNAKLAIQAHNYNNEIIPISLNVVRAGKHMISFEGNDVVLLDNGVRTELMDGEVFEFEAASGLQEQRFAIQLKVDVSTDVKDTKNSEVDVIAIDKRVVIKNNHLGRIHTTIYDMSGNCVLNSDFTDVEKSFDMASKPSGIYIVKIIAKGKAVKKKVLLK